MRTGDMRKVAGDLERTVVLGGRRGEPPNAGRNVRLGRVRGPGRNARQLLRARSSCVAFAPRGPFADVAPPAGRAASTHTVPQRSRGRALDRLPCGVGDRSAPTASRAARGGAEQFVPLRHHAVPLGAVMSPPAAGPARACGCCDDRFAFRARRGRGRRGIRTAAARRTSRSVLRLYALCRRWSRLAPRDAVADGGVTLHGFRAFGTGGVAVTPSP